MDNTQYHTKIFLHICYWILLPVTGIGQSQDSIPVAKNIVKVAEPRTEILSGGFIDIVQTAQMNASARLFKLYIGEPGKFQLPLSLYTGVSSAVSGNSKAAEELVYHLINPSAGIINLGFDGISKLLFKKNRVTSLRLIYAASLRLLPAFNPQLYKATTIVNSNESIGLMLLTGAWERNRAGSTGIFWISARAIISLSPEDQLFQILSLPVKGLLPGYSLGLGIEIYQAVNVKFMYYRYRAGIRPAVFQQPLFQAGFNYSLR